MRPTDAIILLQLSSIVVGAFSIPWTESARVRLLIYGRRSLTLHCSAAIPHFRLDETEYN
jgi:hypothetical protein